MTRLKNKETKLAPWKDFTSWCDRFPKNKRLIIGSGWPYEMNIFRDMALYKQVKEGLFLVMIAPHKLNPKFIAEIEENIPDLPAYRLDCPSDINSLKERWRQNPGPLIFNAPGILLECYSLFGHAVVGGGHQGGVHSLLEPFWAGCRIYCGPNIERSTEYTFLEQLPSPPVQIVEEWEQFSSWFKTDCKKIPYNILEQQAFCELDSVIEWSLLKSGTKDA